MLIISAISKTVCLAVQLILIKCLLLMNLSLIQVYNSVYFSLLYVLCLKDKQGQHHPLDFKGVCAWKN